MHFKEDHLYHVYNRGNNRSKIFFNDANYLFLLKKVRQEWLAYCDILNYCLMPNHFHFTLMPNKEGCRQLLIGNQPSYLQQFSKTIGLTLSSYTRAINNQNKTTGSLFQKKTRAKCLTDIAIRHDGLNATDYLDNCFRYIHNNPLAALLVDDIRDWPWSSWHEYFGSKEKGICNLELAKRVLSPEILSNHEVNGLPLNLLAVDGIW